MDIKTLEHKVLNISRNMGVNAPTVEVCRLPSNIEAKCCDGVITIDSRTFAKKDDYYIRDLVVHEIKHIADSVVIADFDSKHYNFPSIVDFDYVMGYFLGLSRIEGYASYSPNLQFNDVSRGISTINSALRELEAHKLYSLEDLEPGSNAYDHIVLNTVDSSDCKVLLAAPYEFGKIVGHVNGGIDKSESVVDFYKKFYSRGDCPGVLRRENVMRILGE
ncbi:hypothetical protein JXM83_01795 [Candidatus Woesearchaeota archaeon]|nr:hypothetical protein [Candidatus Woesearchaeota archaeon]